jgi:polysaccharide export outer membrane protein
MKGLLTGLGVAFGVLVHSSGVQAGEYKIQIGDRLEINVAGLPLQRTMVVDTEGMVSVPLLGELAVKGRSLREVVALVKQQLPTKVYTLRTTDGREAPTVISADEISLTIAEYRPVYLTGQIARPGEQVYRAQMTVRQAVALAGGYGLPNFRSENSALLAQDIEQKYRETWLDFVRLNTRVQRLNSDLALPAREPTSKLPSSPLSRQAQTQISDLELERLNAEAARYHQERLDIEKLMVNAESRINIYSQQLTKEEEGAELDNSEAERYAELARKGTVPLVRAAESRRLSLLSATRALQVNAQAENQKRERANFERELRALDAARRLKLLGDLQESRIELAKSELTLGSLVEKMSYFSSAPLISSGSARLRIGLLRKGPESVQQIDATEDTSLEPGDVIDVQVNFPEQE